MLGQVARAQDTQLPFAAAPPPMKYVPRGDRERLSSLSDPKSRTRTALELAEARLAHAEQLTAGGQYEAAADDLGVYQGLIEEALRFLGERAKEKRDKTLDTYKRLELAVRGHSARLEAVRRLTPSEYAVNVKAVCQFARDARAAALNAYFGDTVIGDSAATDKPAAQKATEAIPDEARKQ
jgi:hypothetical protein